MYNSAPFPIAFFYDSTEILKSQNQTSLWCFTLHIWLESNYTTGRVRFNGFSRTHATVDTTNSKSSQNQMKWLEKKLFWEYLKYMTLNSHLYDLYFFQEKFKKNALSSSQKRAFLKTSKAAHDFVYWKLCTHRCKFIYIVE